MRLAALNALYEGLSQYLTYGNGLKYGAALGATVATGVMVNDIIRPSAEDKQNMFLVGLVAPQALMVAPLLVISAGAVFGAGAGLFAAGMCQNPALTAGLALSTCGIYKQATAKPSDSANTLSETPNVRHNP